MLRGWRFYRRNERIVKVKLDEGLSYRLKPTLQVLGHDVDTVIEEGLKSEDDAVIAQIASQNNRMLFTLDRGLGDVRQYTPGKHSGIVVFRNRFVGPGTVNKFVEEFVRNHNLDDLMGCLVIVEPGKVRIRRKDDEGENKTISSK